MRRKVVWLLLSVLLVCAGSGVSSAADYYISTAGNDSNRGTIDHPWRNIYKALDVVHGGNTVYVRGGNYDYSSVKYAEVWMRSDHGHGGTLGNMFILRNYPGETPVLTNVRFIIDCPYVRVEGFRLKASAGFLTGLAISNWHGTCVGDEVVGNTIQGMYRFGAIEAMGINCLIEGNIIDTKPTGDTMDHAIYVHGTDGNVIRGNIINANGGSVSGYGLHLYDETGHTMSNMTVENNFVRGSLLRSGVQLTVGGKSQIKGVMIRNNVVVENAFQAIGMYYGNRATVQNVKIYNNTFSGNGLQNLAIFGGSGISIQNNIMGPLDRSRCSRDCGWFKRAHVDKGPGAEMVTLDTNLYGSSSERNINITDAHPLYGDPKFVNPGSYDYSLKADSPAIDAGLSLSDVVRDKNGVPRPQGKAYDIGAYEFRNGSSSSGK